MTDPWQSPADDDQSRDPGTGVTMATPITTAEPAAPLAAGAAPIAILVDYDGTIAINDVSDQILVHHVPGSWDDDAKTYDSGGMGSRRLMTWEVSLIDADPAEVFATAAGQVHDRGFVDLVERARGAGIPVEVVSDGYGFFIRPALESLGLGDLPIVTANTVFHGRQASISFPNGHPTCRVCGTCKRERVRAHQAAGRTVVFIGDGTSDRYAAGYADVVWAKRALIAICEEAGWSFRRWAEFAEIDAWLEHTIDAWREDPASLPGPQARPFFCGPEAWGDGLDDPPAGSWPPPPSEPSEVIG